MAIVKRGGAAVAVAPKAKTAPKAKAPKAPRVKGKAFVFYAKGEAAAMVEKIKAKGSFSETVLSGLGIEFSEEK